MSFILSSQLSGQIKNKKPHFLGGVLYYFFNLQLSK